MHINSFVNFCNDLFPFERALEGDKIGLQILNKKKLVERVLVTLEITNEVVEEAKLLEIDTIVSFHPLIYRGFDLSKEERVENLVREIVINDMNVVVIHTNFDTFEFGTNFILAKELELKIIDYLLPKNKRNNKNQVSNNDFQSSQLQSSQLQSSHLQSNDLLNSFGMGLICKPMVQSNGDNNLEYWLNKISDTVNSPIKYTTNYTNNVNNIAIISGSGSSFIDDVLDYNLKVENESAIDTFITADITYHTFHRCKGLINLIDIGHYEMEQFVPKGIFKILKENLTIKNSNFNSKDNNQDIINIKFYLSKVLTNPVDYFPSKNYKENQLNYLLNH